MRTTQEILAEMDSVQAGIPEAASLTSKSATSVFGMLRNLWALFVQALENNIDTLTADLNTYVASIQVGSIAWYAAQIKAFQFGDSVTLINGKPGYVTIDPDKQIIKQVAVIETEGRLLIKVAKANPSAPSYSALSDAELVGLKDYVRLVKYAGVAADVVSLPPDDFRIFATIKYDRQVLGPDGRPLADPNQDTVLDLITSYVRALPFDGVLSWTALTDFMQKYSGIDDFLITRTFIRPAGATDFTEFTRETATRAGHMRFLDANITYV